MNNTEHNHMHIESGAESDAVSKRVLETIESEGVTPKPRWEFLLTRSALWSAYFVSIAVGALAVAAALFSLSHSGWRYYAATHHSLFEFVITSLPYLWIVVLIAFSGIAYYNARHTEGGYRYSLVAIVSLSVAGSLVLGFLLHVIGWGRIIDERAGHFAPFYHPAVELQEALWNAPEDGRIAGVVTAYTEDQGVLVVRTFDGTLWNVTTEDLRNRDLETLAESSVVRVIGVPTTSEATIHGCFIFPWDFDDMPPLPQNIPHRNNQNGEINMNAERSTECKGVRPYAALLKLQSRALSH